MMLIYFILSLSFRMYLSSNIPEYIHICARSDPNVSNCVRESVELLRPKLKMGIPEINAPPMEPFFINNITLFNGQDSLGLKATLFNLEVSGVSDFQIKKLRINIDKLNIFVNLYFPILKILADYDINGQLSFLRLEGNGKFYANATDIRAKAILRAGVIGKENRKQMKFNYMDMKLKVGNYEVLLDNLFNGDPILGRTTNLIINEAKEDMLSIVVPLLEKEISRIVVDFANMITSSFDFEEIFPEHV